VAFRGNFGIGVSALYYVYLLSDRNNKLLYTGMTDDLRRTLHEHKYEEDDEFITRNQINRLVYYEYTTDPRYAFNRQRRIRIASRQEKTMLVEDVNPDWRDLSLDF
jgi:putative endonuclease